MKINNPNNSYIQNLCNVAFKTHYPDLNLSEGMIIDIKGYVDNLYEDYYFDGKKWIKDRIIYKES